MNKNFGMMIIGAAILFLWFVGTASATTWSVDDDGGADFIRIQDAIDNSSDGDTILVYTCVYSENVVVNKSVTLRGIGQPVVDAGRHGSAVTLTAEGITIEGFNVTNSRIPGGGVGIKVISSNNTITGNNVCYNKHGIRLLRSCNNTITGNTVCNNDYKGIVLAFSCNNNTITGNTVCNNSRYGIVLFISSNNNTITSNVFVNDSLFVMNSYQNTVEDNIVNDKPLVYLEDVSNYKVEDAGQVILVNCSNITIENLDLSNISVGIDLWETKNSTISNNKVCNNRFGIRLSSSCNNTITGNTINNNRKNGIALGHSGNNTITGNTFVNNGLFVDEPYHLTVEDNTVNGKPLVYLEDVSNYRVKDAGQVILVNCSNISAENLDLSNTSVGIELWETKDSTISNNKVCSNSDDGIRLSSSCNNNIITCNNVCNNNWHGIHLKSSCNNTITDNNVYDNRYGIWLRHSSSNNILTENKVCNNEDGICIDSSYNNSIIGNNICNNSGDGICIDSSYNNSIIGNNICNNSGDGIYIDSSYSKSIIGNNICNNSGDGIYIDSSCNNSITDNNVCNNKDNGIYFQDSNNNWITDNNASNNDNNGISLGSSNDNEIYNNSVNSNLYQGIGLWTSIENIITNNTAKNNGNDGIYLDYSSNNTITGNTVCNNNDDGICFSGSDSNLIYLNNFIDNTDSVYYFDTGTNIWNSAEKITYCYNGSTHESYLGNYWHDYEEKYPDAEAIDTTGIWDTPYNIDGDKDNYPLMERFENYGMIRSPIVHPPAAEPIIAPGDNFTEFYILGPTGTASGYPTNLTVGEDGKVIIGIVNHEYTNVTYQLEVLLSRAHIGGNSIELKHNETWESPFTFRVTKTGRQKLEFLLFKDGLKEPYRNLHLWVDVK